METPELTFEQLKAAWKKNDNKESRPSNYYNFYNMKPGETATIRFLPDKNKSNPLGFTVEKYMHPLEINGEKKAVACLRMYGEECPICKVSSEYYKAEGKNSVNGKKYWRKKQNIFQALVLEDPLPPNPDTGENHEGKVRFLNIGYQLYTALEEGFNDIKNFPYLLKGGYNFIIKKTLLGEQAKYDVGSKFIRDPSDLTEDEIAYVEEHIVDLSTLIPPHPGIEKVEAMLTAALTGGVYVDESKDSSVSVSDETAETTTSVAAAAPAKDPAPEFSEDKDDILAQIRARKPKTAV